MENKKEGSELDKTTMYVIVREENGTALFHQHEDLVWWFVFHHALQRSVWGMIFSVKEEMVAQCCGPNLSFPPFPRPWLGPTPPPRFRYMLACSSTIISSSLWKSRKKYIIIKGGNRSGRSSEVYDLVYLRSSSI